MSMRTRSSSARNRVDYKKLANEHEEDELQNPRPTSKARRDPPSPSAPAPAPLIAPIPPPSALAQLEQAAAVKDDKDPDKPATGSGVTDTSKIIDEFLKALRPDTEEQPGRSNQAPRPVQVVGQDGTASMTQSPTVQNHSYDTLPPPRQRPEISVQKDTKFPCTFARYGCTSTFGSKNEWKRHVAIQHVQLGFYRCDVGVCNPDNRDPHSRDSGYNDFNRKDLFTMHQRRMHSPWGVARQPTSEEKEGFETSLESVRQRCWRAKRQPPLRTTCGFCGRVFEDKLPVYAGIHLSNPPGAGLVMGQDTSAISPEQQQLQQQGVVAGQEERPDTMDVDRQPVEGANDAQSPLTPGQRQSYGQASNASPVQHISQPTSAYPPLTPGAAPSTYPPVPSPGTASSYPPLPNFSQTPDSVQRPLAPGPPPPQQIKIDAHGQPIVKDPTAWEDRMEHVGRHLAKEDAHLREEAEDPDLTAWGLREGLLRDCGPKGVWLIGHEPQGDSLDGIIRKRKKRIK